MGIYDHFADAGRLAQVKIYDDAYLRTFRPGDEVPALPGGNPPRHYSVALAHGDRGYFANVHASVFTGITDRPVWPVVIDKWGNPVGAA